MLSCKKTQQPRRKPKTNSCSVVQTMPQCERPPGERQARCRRAEVRSEFTGREETPQLQTVMNGLFPTCSIENLFQKMNALFVKVIVCGIKCISQTRVGLSQTRPAPVSFLNIKTRLRWSTASSVGLTERGGPE